MDTHLFDLRAQAWAESDEFSARFEAGEKLSDADLAAWRRAVDTVERLGEQLGDGYGVPGGRNARGSTNRGLLGSSVNEPADSAFRHYLRTGDDSELRAQGTEPGSAGGYTVPQGFWAKVTNTLKAFGGLRRFAETVETDSGERLPWPTNDDTNNEGAILAENTQAPDSAVTFGQAELEAFMYTSGVVRVSHQLLQDSGINLEVWLADRLGRRIGRAQARHWINGSGTGEPQGILAGATVGKVAGVDVGYDDLVDLVHSVDPAYREGAERAGDSMDVSGTGWLMSDFTLSALRKIVDGHGRPLIEPDVRGAAPNTLLGYRVAIDNAMPGIEAGATPIAFGNFRAGYVIRDVRGLQVARLIERYADYLQVGYLAYGRSDGTVQDTSAVKLLQTGGASS